MDDLVLVLRPDSADKIIHTFRKTCEEFGLVINIKGTSKTALMKVLLERPIDSTKDQYVEKMGL